MSQPVAPSPGVPNAPSSTEVNRFHANSDVDSGTNSQHHTLGILHNQASPGDHQHDGHSSKRVGKGKDLAFPVTAAAAYNQAQIQSIINALRLLGWGT
jgi:hypothetical protein